MFLGKIRLKQQRWCSSLAKIVKKSFKVIGGRFDGQLYTGADVERLSTLPGKDEMRAQFLSVFEAPLSQTLGSYEALLTSVPYCLDNKSKQEENTENAGKV